MPADEPRTVADLIDRVQLAWAALEDVIAPLSDAQLTTPGPPDGWAVKDHLVHITDWERATLSVLRRQPQSLGLGVDPLPDDVDALNAVMYERSRALEIDEVMDRLRATHAELLAALHHVSDADLAKTRAEYGPEPALTDRTLFGKIAGDTYAHYAEHVEWIGDLLRALE